MLGKVEIMELLRALNDDYGVEDLLTSHERVAKVILALLIGLDVLPFEVRTTSATESELRQ